MAQACIICGLKPAGEDDLFCPDCTKTRSWQFRLYKMVGHALGPKVPTLLLGSLLLVTLGLLWQDWRFFWAGVVLFALGVLAFFACFVPNRTL